MDTPAYIVARIVVEDWAAYSEYMKRTPKIVKQYGGRFIARGAEPVTLEGEKETRRMVIMEFLSAEGAKAFYESEEYGEARRIRSGGASAQFVLLDGYPLEEWDQVVAESENLGL